VTRIRPSLALLAAVPAKAARWPRRRAGRGGALAKAGALAMAAGWPSVPAGAG